MLYVHIPYCVHKCHYCDFNSHERLKPDWSGYQHALCRELIAWTECAPFKTRPLGSIFFGGGTPSLAPPELIAAIIACSREHCGHTSDIEITLEANPGTVDASHFQAYHRAGINRLSMGVQSLNREELRWLERIHDEHQVIAAFNAARDAGFDNINLDLMYGLPKQSLQPWLQTLNEAIALAPEHLSCYQLTVEPHTRLAAKHRITPYPLPDDELALQLFYNTRTQLHQAGYHPYEISNFSQHGYHCRHNDGYWRYADYIGIGAGASGKWDQRDGGISRYSNIRTPERYIEMATKDGTAINSQEQLSRQEATAEAFWLALRRQQGIEVDRFKNRFGCHPLEQFTTPLQPWLQQGMLIASEKSISLSHQGLALADTIAACVL